MSFLEPKTMLHNKSRGGGGGKWNASKRNRNDQCLHDEQSCMHIIVTQSQNTPSAPSCFYQLIACIHVWIMAVLRSPGVLLLSPSSSCSRRSSMMISSMSSAKLPWLRQVATVEPVLSWCGLGKITLGKRFLCWLWGCTQWLPGRWGSVDKGTKGRTDKHVIHSPSTAPARKVNDLFWQNVHICLPHWYVNARF